MACFRLRATHTFGRLFHIRPSSRHMTASRSSPYGTREGSSLAVLASLPARCGPRSGRCFWPGRLGALGQRPVQSAPKTGGRRPSPGTRPEGPGVSVVASSRPGISGLDLPFLLPGLALQLGWWGNPWWSRARSVSLPWGPTPST